MVCIMYNIIKLRNCHDMWVVGGFCGSMWVMGEWAVGQWIVDITSFKKIYDLKSVQHHKVEKLS